MATVSSIASAIATQLGALTFVNAASATSYLPAVASVTCVAFVVPFDQETRAEVRSLDGDITLRHTLTVEFWTQVRNDRIADAMTTARDAGALAITRLVQYDGTGYTLSADIPFQERILPEPVKHVNVPWVITILRVPVENEVTI
jgi:hypothetical protein